MGTNYYLTYNLCMKCGRYDRIHIGKASAGWQFTFQALPDKSIISAKDWETWTTRPGRLIIDEYGKEHSPSEFWNMVKERQRDPSNINSYIFQIAEMPKRGYTVTSYLDEEGYAMNPRDFS